MTFPRVRPVFAAVAIAVVSNCAVAAAQTLPCPGPATEGALVAAVQTGASTARLVEWIENCGVAFPVVLVRLAKAGVTDEVAATAIMGHYFYLVSHASDENIGWILLNTEPGSVAPPFTAAQKTEVVAAGNTPWVAAIRKLFTRYSSARQLMTSPDEQRLAKLLDALPPEVPASPFLVLAVNGMSDGVTVTILSAHASHAVLDVHVNDDGGIFFLRRKPLPAEVRERLAGYYGAMLKDADYLR